MTSGERKPVAPFYAVGALWLVCGALLPLYSVMHYLLLAAISAAGFLLINGLCRSSGAAGAEASEPPAPAPQASADPALDKLLQEGQAALTEMKRLNDSIAAPGISADITRLEQISGKIFQEVRRDPQKRTQIQRFLDYYLPTTLKLLNAYERMSTAGVSGENIGATLSKIEGMIDTVVKAFEKQLDTLYGAEALDISAEISVLETMMQREGLTGEGPDGGEIRLQF